VDTKLPPIVELDTTIRQNDDHVAADMDGELALMSIENGKYYCLNPTGSRIWKLIEQPGRIEDICAVLAQEYAVEPQQCESEVLDHVAKLVAENLVEIVQPAAA